MNITMIPLSQLKPNQKNVRLHSAKQLEEYKRSVQKFGQTKAIVIDESYTILIGNGLYEAMKALGLTEAACFMKQGMSEHDKLKMMMADNKVYSLGVDNLEAIEDIIAELGETKDFDIPGYDEDLLQALTFDSVNADDFMSGYGIIDGPTKASMDRAAVRYQEEEREFAESAVELSPARPTEATDLRSSGSEEEGNINIGFPETPQETRGIALQRRFLVCPKCGEKIWL